MLTAGNSKFALLQVVLFLLASFTVGASVSVRWLKWLQPVDVWYLSIAVEPHRYTGIVVLTPPNVLSPPIVGGTSAWHTIYFKPLQPVNALSPMLLTLPGIV